MTSSARLKLPLLSPGQAQKEVFHNEALQMLDLIVAACVEEPPRSSPPSSPAIGSCYIVAAAGQGSWSGYDDHLAAYTSAGWRFAPPLPGLQALIRSTGLTARFNENRWEVGSLNGTKVVIAGHQVISAQGAAIANPVGGAVIDVEARNAVNQVLARMREHGLIA
jgi:hypothetical protein